MASHDSDSTSPCIIASVANTLLQESVLDEQDSQWQRYMSNESSGRALFENADIKILFVQVKKNFTILLFYHISSSNLYILLIYSILNRIRLSNIAENNIMLVKQ